jgi:hypothetical protein
MHASRWGDHPDDALKTIRELTQMISRLEPQERCNSKSCNRFFHFFFNFFNFYYNYFYCHCVRKSLQLLAQ